MKLALVTRWYPPRIGGAEKVLSYLAQAIAEEGAEVTVLTSQVPGMPLPPAEEIPLSSPEALAAKNGGDIHQGRLRVVRLGTVQIRVVGTWLYMRNLRYWLEHNRIVIAYVSMLKHDAYVTVEAGRRLDFPVVLRPEGAGVTGDLAWQSWGNFGRQIGRRCREADAFVAISRAIEDELVVAGYEPGKIHTLPNGVPVPDEPWHPWPDWRESPRALYVGRLAPEKGLDTLIEAWPRVLASFPRARLTLIGTGPEQPRLETQALGLGLTLGPGQAIEMSGAVVEATDNLRQADLFILPSREEGMSVALLEAMALGLPIVASAIAGNRRLVGDCEHGRLATVDDPEALARAVIDQWADFNRAVDMGRAARIRVIHEFSIRTVARKHLELFQGLIAH